MRIEPPPSLAVAMGTMRAATAALEPPLDLRGGLALGLERRLVEPQLLQKVLLRVEL